MKTAKFLTAAGAALCIAGLSAPANANPWPVEVDGTATISGHDSDPGLVVQTSSTPFSGSFGAVGDSFQAEVFTIWTNEGSVESDDTVSYPITASFSFTSPDGASGPAVTGNTFGEFIWWNPLDFDCGTFTGGCGQLVWNNGGLSEIVYSNVGRFSVVLDNATFGTNGNPVGVNGTFTLLAAVPEPSTWAMMILGFGAVGFMMRSRRRENVSVSYA